MNLSIVLEFVLSLNHCLKETEAVGYRCSSKYVLLKISYISQENTCVGVSFKKVAGLQTCNFIKKRLKRRCFPVKNSFYYRTPMVAASEQNLDELFVPLSLTPMNKFWRVPRLFILLYITSNNIKKIFP